MWDPQWLNGDEMDALDDRYANPKVFTKKDNQREIVFFG
jgi:hypothetical protein